VQGYANTRGILLTSGEAQVEGAAGTIYYAVPTVLRAYQTDGSIQRFYGCYLLTRSNVPTDDAGPPFSIFIRSAHIISASDSTDEREFMNRAVALVRARVCTQ
jgi:hypothetical protein